MASVFKSKWKLNEKHIGKYLNKFFYPSVTMLRFLTSESYSNNIIKENAQKKKRVLDIGCLYLNNLLPFKDRNFLLYGTETDQKNIKILKKNAKLKKIDVNLRFGLNSFLPFKSSFFDVLLSINTIQYEQNISGVHKALKEMKRVLKKNNNSIIYVETPAPSHYFIKKCKKLSKNIFISKDENEFRYNDKFFFFNSKKEIKQIFSKYFRNVEIGSVKEVYPKRTVNFYTIKASI